MPPSNISFATATTISSLPYDFTQTDINDAGVNFTVYYKFTAPVGATGIGVWGFSGNIGSGYRPTARAYTGPAGSPVSVLPTAAIFGQNIPIQFQVTAGLEYFLEFTKNVDTAGPEDLRIQVEVAPNITVQSGDILINDDTGPFPLVVLSPTVDHTIKNIIANIVNGEQGDVIDNVIALVHAADLTVVLYSLPNFSVIFTSSPGIESLNIRRAPDKSKFYTIYRSGSNSIVRTLSGAGVFGSDITLTGIPSPAVGNPIIGVNNAEDIIYTASIANNQPIKKSTLPSGAALADLVAGVASYKITDILVLTDDTVLALYFNATTRDVFVRRYSTAGATLNTYNAGLQGLTATIPRMAWALDNPNSFWIWLHDSGISRFFNIRVSDGVTLATRTQTVFASGRYAGTETATPTARFGNSSSCPFLIALVTSNFRSGIYVLEPSKRNDTLYINVDSGTTEDVKIPDPTYKIASLGE